MTHDEIDARITDAAKFGHTSVKIDYIDFHGASRVYKKMGLVVTEDNRTRRVQLSWEPYFEEIKKYINDLLYFNKPIKLDGMLIQEELILNKYSFTEASYITPLLLPLLKKCFCNTIISLPSYMNSDDIEKYINDIDDNTNYVYCIEKTVYKDIFFTNITHSGHRYTYNDGDFGFDKIYVPSNIATLLKIGYEGIIINHVTERA